MSLFVRKNKGDKISKKFYFLGKIKAVGRPQTITMAKKTAVEIQYQLVTPVREDIYEYMYSYWDDDMVIGRDHYSISENTDVIHRVNHLDYNYNGTFIFINP